MQNVPGEAAIPQQAQQQIAPDVSGQQGQAQLFTKAVQAHQAKQSFDAILKVIADRAGGSIDSRVKNIETMTSKITQKRMEGRPYGIDDLTDVLGGRIIMDSKKDFPGAIKDIEKLGKAGLFTIDKKEDASHGNYSGYHIDVTLQNGTKAELQLHTKNSEAESLINHGLRSVHGENMPPIVKQLADKQADMVNRLEPDKAQALSGALKQVNKQANGQPLDPRISAALLAQAKGGGNFGNI